MALVSTLTAGELGKGMKLEYGKRGLPTMKLGERKQVSSPRRMVSASPRHHLATDAECLRRLRQAGVRIRSSGSGCGYRVELAGKLENLRYRGDGYWRAGFRGTEFVLTEKARADHALAIRGGRPPAFKMSLVNGGCLLKSARELGNPFFSAYGVLSRQSDRNRRQWWGERNLPRA